MHTGTRADTIDDLYYFSEIAFHTHLSVRDETMNIKKYLIYEPLLFIVYVGFGFLIFPAGL